MASTLRQDVTCFTLSKCFFHEEWYVLNNFWKLKKGGNVTIAFKKHFQRLRHLLNIPQKIILIEYSFRNPANYKVCQETEKIFFFIWTISESVIQARDRAKKHFALCYSLCYGQWLLWETPGIFRGNIFYS